VAVNVGPAIEALTRLSNATRQPSWLFDFTFHDHHVRGIVFARARTILLGIEDRNVAWLIPISEGGVVTGWIPEEVFPDVVGLLKDDTSKATTAPLFVALAEALVRLAKAGDAKPASEDEILRLCGRCRTKTARYGADSESPYFGHWSRVPPSPENRRKIQDYFGYRVRDFCYRNKVTAVWFRTPKKDSLLFIDPAQALTRIDALLARPKPGNDRQAVPAPRKSGPSAARGDGQGRA
jgi:hypothetical protein